MNTNHSASIYTNQSWKINLKVFRSYLGFQWRRFKRSEKVKSGPEAKTLSRELKKFGFAKIENYLSAAECQEMIKELDRLLLKHSEILREDNVKSDHRLNIAQGVSPIIDRFHNDPFLAEVGGAYFGCRMTNMFTLAARLDYKEANEGSGGGWHRDAFFFQYKAMLYLSDVGPDNGPFQIVEKSHHIWKVLRDRAKMKASSFTYRLSSENIRMLLETTPNRLKTLEGKAGTLLLFDSSSVHRGMPIKSGQRYALTNYYLPIYQYSDRRIAEFEPILRPKN